MTHQPSISVIIPAYNCPATLITAVDSALAQTYAPAEILIVIDHATDTTAQVAQALAGAHNQVRVYQVPDGVEGVSSARNMGIAQSTGELITFLDADDALEPMMLEVLVGLMQEMDADIAGCDFREGDGSTARYMGADIIARAILIDHDTRVWSKLYKRSTIEGITFPTDMTIGEDMLFLTAAAVRKDLSYVVTHQRLYDYTINPLGAMERPFIPSYMDQIRCWDRFETMVTELLHTETYLRLRAVQITSAVLVGSKIATAGVHQYAAEWASARESLRHYRQDSGAIPYLPAGYGMKARLMDKAPDLFVLLCKKKYK